MTMESGRLELEGGVVSKLDDGFPSSLKSNAVGESIVVIVAIEMSRLSWATQMNDERNSQVNVM